ncbi:MAG TPA: aromatic-ring-hydroxylating dioxygenase subunit beta [Candidatus Cybelea sp.]|nr:aromatic-ring-hydroxylating dioxygenase subunit beta [Candidatus Cybelea sp.]
MPTAVKSSAAPAQLPDVGEIERFLSEEARMLDEGRYDEWLGLFTDDGIYWVPLEPGQTDPINHVSLFYEDRLLREMRVKRLRHPRAFSLEPPLRTARLVGNVMVDAGEGGEIIVRSTFHMMESRRDEQRMFGGTYTHRLVAAGGGLRIKLKRVDLINCDAVHEALQTFI